MKTLEMEIVIADYFNWRQNIIAPNISWGAGLHECDLLVITKSGYATEIEIKVSKADLKKDLQKSHNHGMAAPKYFVEHLSEHEQKEIFSDKIKYLYFAMPEKICNVETINIIPEKAGIIIVKEKPNRDHFMRDRVKIIRKPINKSEYCFNEKERYNILRLATMRTWRLKEKLNEANK